MNNSPWAKLPTSMMPKIKVSPEATSARIMPVTMPLIVWISSWSNGISMPIILPGLLRHSRESQVPVLHTQILMDDRVADAQLRGHCVVPDHALFDEIDPPRSLQRQRHVLLNEQHRHIVFFQHADDFPDLRHH